MAVVKLTLTALAALAAPAGCRELRGISVSVHRPDGEFTEVDFLLEEYVRTHRASNLDPEQGFVVGTYGCPKQFGNRMHEFLNAFATAVVTGRNLVWRYTSQRGVHAVGTVEECEEAVHRKQWIPSDSVLEDMNVTTRLIENASELACSELDSYTTGQEVAEHAVWEQYQASVLAHADARLSVEAKERARILFSKGVEFAYGKLWNAAFEFDTEMVVRPSFEVLRDARLVTKEGIRTQQDSFWVGVHLRHKSEMSLAERRWIAITNWNLVKQALDDKQAKGLCAVLLATDDNVTEDIVRPWVAMQGCTLVRSRFDEEETSWSSEHGSHTGVGALRDVYLLSLADALFGTTWSSFTQSIAERILARNEHATFVQCGKYTCATNSSLGFPFNNKMEAPCA